MGHIASGSLLAAIGFTVSLFITDLAFINADLVNEAKVGVLLASSIASLIGYAALWLYLGKESPIKVVNELTSFREH